MNGKTGSRKSSDSPKVIPQLPAKGFNAGAPDPVLSSPGHEKVPWPLWLQSLAPAPTGWAVVSAGPVHRSFSANSMNLFRLPFNVLGPHTCQVHLGGDSGHLRPISLGPSPPTPWQRIPAPGVSSSTSRVLSQDGEQPPPRQLVNTSALLDNRETAGRNHFPP